MRYRNHGGPGILSSSRLSPGHQEPLEARISETLTQLTHLYAMEEDIDVTSHTEVIQLLVPVPNLVNGVFFGGGGSSQLANGAKAEELHLFEWMQLTRDSHPPRPVVFTITAIFNNYKLLFHERLGRTVFNFHSGRHLSVCRGCNLWSGSGSGTGGFLAWRRAAADRAFPFSPSWFPPGCGVTSVAPLLRVVASAEKKHSL